MNVEKLRYPAVPLITVDPYFSVWSCADRLYDDTTRHWTGSRQNLLGIIAVDGQAYRFMGRLFADNLYSETISPLPQTDVTVRPMRTVYTFQNEIIRLKLTFMTPLLLDDLKLMSRPVSYISYEVTSLDGREHNVKLYIALSSELAVDDAMQQVKVHTYTNGVCCGRGGKEILSGSGDNRRIDWGWLHLFSTEEYTPEVLKVNQILQKFNLCIGVEKPPVDNTNLADGREFSVCDGFAYISLDREFTVSANSVCGFVCAAYDDIHSIEYFGRQIDAYYKKDGDTFENVCKKALSEYQEICAEVEEAEKELLEKANRISPKYADIISLAYRQSIAAHKLTWDGEEMQFFSKECFSNGCIGTLDVTYPSIPLFLLYNPSLVEGMLNPIFKYALSGEWKYEFAPHDVGQYPIANGQVYGRNRETGEIGLKFQMPVEECGNAILCVYALCHYTGNVSYAEKHLAPLKKWADYLIENGLDPQNQLCTDDFAGHLAHNCNLSAKAIMGIYGFGKIQELLGNKEEGEKYVNTAKKYAREWQSKADDGDHYRLAFGSEDTWSLKYNLVWDRIFDWGIFDNEVFDKERRYYMQKFNTYGLPLDCRSDYTKSDWLMWSTMLFDDEEYTGRIIETIWNMLNDTPNRIPFTDWYHTTDARQAGFQNRTVQGGLFINLI